MQIKLYGENDTRPVGAYEWASSAFVTPFNILFVSQTGVQILSTLRFKITLDTDDTVAFNKLNSNYEITGMLKPKEAPKELTKQKKGKEDDFDTIKPITSAATGKANRPPRGSVGVPQEMACNDSDEKHIPRAKRKNVTTRNAGASGYLFPDAALFSPIVVLDGAHFVCANRVVAVQRGFHIAFF